GDVGVLAIRAMRQERPHQVTAHVALQPALIVVAGKHAGVAGWIGRLVRADHDELGGRRAQVASGRGAEQPLADNNVIEHRYTSVWYAWVRPWPGCRRWRSRGGGPARRSSRPAHGSVTRP